MIEVSRVMPVARERVYAVLADGWSYAGWVVGNAHVREVDDDWPAEGSGIHHKAGLWPVQVPDVSTVVAVSRGKMIEIEARLWILGRARVRVTLESVGAASTRVVMAEQAVSGPAGWMPGFVQALVLRPRNAEALARLQDIAIGRTTGDESRRARGDDGGGSHAIRPPGEPDGPDQD